MSRSSLKTYTCYTLLTLTLLAYPVFKVNAVIHIYLYFIIVIICIALLLLNQVVLFISWGLFLSFWWGVPTILSYSYSITTVGVIFLVECFFLS